MAYDIPSPADYIVSVYDRQDRVWTRAEGYPGLWQHGDIFLMWRQLVAEHGPIEPKDRAQ